MLNRWHSLDFLIWEVFQEGDLTGEFNFSWMLCVRKRILWVVKKTE